MYTEYDLLYAFIRHFGPQNLKILAVPLFMLEWLYIPCPFFWWHLTERQMKFECWILSGGPLFFSNCLPLATVFWIFDVIIFQTGLVIIDGWLKLTAAAQIAVLFKELRLTLHSILKELIRKPEVPFILLQFINIQFWRSKFESEKYHLFCFPCYYQSVRTCIFLTGTIVPWRNCYLSFFFFFLYS